MMVLLLVNEINYWCCGFLQLFPEIWSIQETQKAESIGVGEGIYIGRSCQVLQVLQVREELFISQESLLNQDWND